MAEDVFESTELRSQGITLVDIYAGAQSRFKNPVKLKRTLTPIPSPAKPGEGRRHVALTLRRSPSIPGRAGMPQNYAIHSVHWFLLGSLYALVAVFRRETGYALAAALAANFGLWVLYANDPDWASGIVLGLLILGLFVVFEKCLAQVVQFVEDMKRWR